MIAIVRPVGDWCNLRCKYCYVGARKHRQTMETELLEKFIEEFLEFPFNIHTFSWHGGEPLLTGLPFFGRVVELQKQFSRKGQRIRNSIQTNGTLINDEWASFFKAHGFKVGVSLDGNKKTHDYFRIDATGHGSFDRVLHGIKILRSHSIEPGILQTLTRETVSYIEENFRFFVRDLGIKSWGLNLCFGEGNLMLNNEEATKAFKTYIELWLAENDESLQIREIDNFLAGILGKKAINACAYNGLCFTTFCVECNGKVYPCNRFSGQQEFLCGDLTKQSLEEILGGALWLRYVERISALSLACRKCEWRDVCRNGCPVLRIGGVEGKYFYCETREKIFSYLKELVKKLEHN